MRLVHTADWHLGHTLGGFARDVEHERFLSWLVDVLAEEQADALLIAGDVFEHGNPASSAQALYYRFLARAKERLPRLQIVVIGGNHDAARHLEAPAPLLASFDVHVVGGVPRALDEAVLPLRDAQGKTAAWVGAVPFVRAADAPVRAGVDDIATGIAALFGDVVQLMRKRRAPGQAMIALGHLHVLGGKASLDSERPIYGNAVALPSTIFADDLAYVALGHLHLAQHVDKETIRYPGSPLPLSMTERAYRHRVLVVDVDGERVRDIRARFVPRTCELLRLPDGDPRPFAEIAPLLHALSVEDRPLDERPFLEVRVRLDEPMPDLRQRVESLLEGKPVRLVRIAKELAGRGAALADAMPAATLGDLEPAAVFQRLYQRTYGGEVPASMRAAFAELVEQVGATLAQANATTPPSSSSLLPSPSPDAAPSSTTPPTAPQQGAGS